MGNSASSSQAFGGLQNEDLEAIAASKPLAFDDPIWNRVINCQVSAPRKGTREAIERAAGAWAKQLAENTNTRNYMQMLRHMIQMLARCTCGDHTRVNELEVNGALNLVLLVRLVSKQQIEELAPEQLAEVSGVNEKAWPNQTDCGQSLMEAVCDAICLQIMTDDTRKHTYGTYLLKAECANLLLVLASSQLTQPQGDSCSPFWKYMISKESHARGLMASLLRHYMDRVPQPQAPAIPQGTLLGISFSSNYFLQPWQLISLAYPSHPQSPVMADRCSLLLLVLINYTKAGSKNPYKAELHHMQDSDRPLSFGGSSDSMDMQRTGSISTDGSSMMVSFNALHEALANSLTDDRTVLLLYMILYTNHQFLNYIMAKSEPGVLLLPILRLLHDSQGKMPNNKYMLLIVLLILSHDAIYSSNIHSVDCAQTSVPWFKDRILNGITLGSLSVVLLVRTFQSNLRYQDSFLANNCLAILANMAPHFNQLHPHAAQKLVYLFEMLQKRVNTLTNEVEKKGTTQAHKEQDLSELDMPNGVTQREDEGNEGAEARLELFREMLQTSLEIINAALQFTLPRNPHLIYCLIHRREAFSSCGQDPKYKPLIENIDTVTSFFSRKVENGLPPTEHSSVEKVIQIIKDASLSWAGHLKMIPLLKFNYEQDDRPEEFFTPYMWSQVLIHCGLSWNSQRLRLFESVQ